MREPIYFFTFQEKTTFIPLKYVYPECLFLIKDHTKVEPLQCYQTECPANRNCAETMAKRIHYLFDNVLPKTELLILYFNFRNTGFYSNKTWVPSLGAGIFTRNFTEPKWGKINRWGFNKCKSESTMLSWVPTNEFSLISGSDDIIIPVNELIRNVDG